MTVFQMNIIRKLARIGASERGQALGEFSMVLAFVALVCIAALTAIGAAVVIPFEDFLSGIGFGGS